MLDVLRGDFMLLDELVDELLVEACNRDEEQEEAPSPANLLMKGLTFGASTGEGVVISYVVTLNWKNKTKI